MKKILKGTTALSPVPVVMATCGTQENANIVTLAWVGTVNSEPPVLTACVRYGRHSYPLIKESGEFTVNLVSRDLVAAADRCGLVSGKNTDKFALCGLHKGKGVAVSCPYIEESPVALECRVIKEVDLKTHAVFFGEIVNVLADERYVDDKGKLSLPEGLLVGYVGGNYVETGAKIGAIGFSLTRK